jgi:hypothetical protein
VCSPAAHSARDPLAQRAWVAHGHAGPVGMAAHGARGACTARALTRAHAALRRRHGTAARRRSAVALRRAVGKARASPTTVAGLDGGAAVYARTWTVVLAIMLNNGYDDGQGRQATQRWSTSASVVSLMATVAPANYARERIKVSGGG